MKFSIPGPVYPWDDCPARPDPTPMGHPGPLSGFKIPNKLGDSLEIAQLSFLIFAPLFVPS